MRVHQIREEMDILLERNVEIEGVFVMLGESGYFVDSEEKKEEKSEGIYVDYPNLKNELRTKVPALGGGRFFYCFPAKVSGVLSKNDFDEFFCRLTSITSLLIEVSGHQFVGIER
jgi:hypothetical protein